jgi:hypothetical protein
MRFAKDWAPSAALFGTTGLVAGIYFTDNWLGHNVLRHIPLIGDRYEHLKPAPPEE